jgi:GTPase SAR1 family protein
MMHEFNVPIQTKDRIVFRLNHNKMIDIICEIEYEGERWIWRWCAGIERWNKFIVQNERFVVVQLLEEMPHNQQIILSKEKEISESFYELLRQLKQHPSYRLKVLNMINDDIRTIWDNI